MTRIFNKNERQTTAPSYNTRPTPPSHKKQNKTRTMQSNCLGDGTKLRSFDNPHKTISHGSKSINPPKTKLTKLNKSLSKPSNSNENWNDIKKDYQNIEAADYMVAWCFDVLISAIKKQKPTHSPPTKLEQLANANVECPMFVTWLKTHNESHHKNGKKEKPVEDLRGCIGCLSPIPILEMKDYAILSGLKDHRFQPITLDEINSLTCKLSFLTSFELCDHIYDWDIGVHGVIINFVSPSGRSHSSTFLPEIALEHNMSHKTAIDKLVRKSGYTGTINESLLERIKATRYQSSIASLTYQQYKTHFKSTLEE